MFKIAVVSGKGGTGKTFISTNLFQSLQAQGRSVQLIDADAEAPNALAFFDKQVSQQEAVFQSIPKINEKVCTFCDRCHDWCSYNAIFYLPPAHMIRVLDDLCHGCGACVEACKSGAITEKKHQLGDVFSYTHSSGTLVIEARTLIGCMSPVPVIKAAIKKAAANTEIVIVDGPPGTSCPFIQTVSACDYALLVTEPTPFGLSDLRQGIETLRKLNIRFGVIINRSDIGTSDVKQYLAEEKIPIYMEIPFNRAIAEDYSSGNLVCTRFPSLCTDLAKMADQIIATYGNSHH
jgi:MinD superfamily P-loop ATPase